MRLHPSTAFQTLLFTMMATPFLLRDSAHNSRYNGHLSLIHLSLFTFMHWRRKWQPTPVFLPRESQGQWSLVGCLVGCRLWGHTESDTPEVTQQQQQQQHYIYYCGQESLRRNGVPIEVNKRVQNVVLGCNLKNDITILNCFQGNHSTSQ